MNLLNLLISMPIWPRAPLLNKSVFLWDNLDHDQWSKITRIILHQRNGWICDQRGFVSSFDAPMILAFHADVLRLVTHSSPRTSAERSDHFCSLAVSLCFERTNRNPLLSACQVDSSQDTFLVSKHCFALEGQNMKLFVDVTFLYSILWRPAVWLEPVGCFLSRTEYLSSSGFSPETP